MVGDCFFLGVGAWGPGGLRPCGMWCFMLNSSPGSQIVFIVKSNAWSPQNSSSRNFSRVLLLHSCVLHLDASERPRNLESDGVRDHL